MCKEPNANPFAKNLSHFGGRKTNRTNKRDCPRKMELTLAGAGTIFDAGLQEQMRPEANTCWHGNRHLLCMYIFCIPTSAFFNVRGM